MKKLLAISILLLAATGCSGHVTSMQDVSSYCRSLGTEQYCDSQGAICAQYSEITLRPYKTAKECRQSCESVRMHSQNTACLPVMQAVEGKCNEFCDANYDD